MIVEFRGHLNPERHHPVANGKAWCLCGEWCYADPLLMCSCCLRALAEEYPCPACEGSGVNTAYVDIPVRLEELDGLRIDSINERYSRLQNRGQTLDE